MARLDAFTAFQNVVDEQKAKGVNNTEGKVASLMPAGQTSPEYGTANQLQGHLGPSLARG